MLLGASSRLWCRNIAPACVIVFSFGVNAQGNQGAWCQSFWVMEVDGRRRAPAAADSRVVLGVGYGWYALVIISALQSRFNIAICPVPY